MGSYHVPMSSHERLLAMVVLMVASADLTFSAEADTEVVLFMETLPESNVITT